MMNCTARDRANEQEVAAVLEAAWNCTLRPFGHFAAIDWFAVRGGVPVAVVELKCRNCSSDSSTSVMLNVRKWLALNLAGVGLGVPAIFVVRFTDGIRWVAVGPEPLPLRMAGDPRRPDPIGRSEPVLEVPIASMHGQRLGMARHD